MQLRPIPLSTILCLTLCAFFNSTVIAQMMPSSAEIARRAAEKAKQSSGQAELPANAKAAKEWPQVTPLGPKKYSTAEILYQNLQQCQGGKTLPDSRYVIDLQKETVLDKQTKLMWKRCPEGVAGEYCELYAPHNAEEQHQSDNHRKWDHVKFLKYVFGDIWQTMERNKSFAGYSGWRIPTVDEFKTLRDENCKVPAANANAFPMGDWGRAHLAGTYWTSSIAYADSGFALRFNFDLAEGYKFNMSDPWRQVSHSGSYAVRLVRNH